MLTIGLQHWVLHWVLMWLIIDDIINRRNSLLYKKRGKGKILSFEDFGTEIGVKWDDGTESHSLQCNKKNNWDLKYW